MHITNHYELSTPVHHDFSEPNLTDQSMKDACDINIMMKNFIQSGNFPEPTIIPNYIDCTSIPSLENAYNRVRTASEAFANLPAEVRKLMDNDPSKMESVLANPDYAGIFLKHGLLIAKEQTPDLKPSGDPVPPAGP